MFTDEISKDDIITDLNCPEKGEGKNTLNETSKES
jgi:hypothetical protein